MANPAQPVKGEVTGVSDRLKNKGLGFSTRQAIRASRDESGIISGREGQWNLEWIMEQGDSHLSVAAPRPATAIACG